MIWLIVIICFAEGIVIFLLAKECARYHLINKNLNLKLKMLEDRNLIFIKDEKVNRLKLISTEKARVLADARQDVEDLERDLEKYKFKLLHKEK